MTWLVAPRRRLDELSPDPRRGWVSRHVDVHQLAPAVGDEDEHVQRLECQRGYREQACRPHVVRVVCQERPPGLARRTPRSTPPVAPNRAVADHDAELEQLASDPLGAPQAILAGHGPDQLPHLGAEMRTSAPRAGLPAPEQTPALPMPADDRLRRDEAQVLAPAGAEAASEDRKELVPGAQPGTPAGASRTSQDGELVAQEQVLEHAVLARARPGEDARGHKPEEFKH